MSAFVVSKSHIDAMVAAGLQGRYGLRWYWEGQTRKLDHSNANEVGAMLLAENVRSVEFRYSPPGREAIYGEGWDTPNQDLPCTLVTVEIAGVQVSAPEYLRPYTFTRPKRVHTPVEMLKAIQCFDYQSCETDDWTETQAYAFCQALKDHAITGLDGYEDAKWGL